jgi:phenylalanyl-tRNA synthetase alpha chain
VQGGFKPAKYFSIDRVFRNETLDATHLAEFHQIEGVIADYGLTLGNLIGASFFLFLFFVTARLQLISCFSNLRSPV